MVSKSREKGEGPWLPRHQRRLASWGPCGRTECPPCRPSVLVRLPPVLPLRQSTSLTRRVAATLALSAPFVARALRPLCLAPHALHTHLSHLFLYRRTRAPAARRLASRVRSRQACWAALAIATPSQLLPRRPPSRRCHVSHPRLTPPTWRSSPTPSPSVRRRRRRTRLQRPSGRCLAFAALTWRLCGA